MILNYCHLVLQIIKAEKMQSETIAQACSKREQNQCVNVLMCWNAASGWSQLTEESVVSLIREAGKMS